MSLQLSAWPSCGSSSGMRTARYPWLYICMLLLFCSCSNLSLSKPSAEVSYPEAFDSIGGPADAVEEQAANPVAVEVAQAFVDSEQNLHVKVHVEARTAIDPRTVKLFFRGLSSGEVITEQERLLSEDSDREALTAGETVVARFIVPAKDLNEYQIEAAWGIEPPLEAAGPVSAPGATAEMQPAPSDGGVVQVLEVDAQALECEFEPCNVHLVVTAVLKNEGAAAIEGAKLAVGLVWREEGQPLPPLPSSEEALPGEDVVELSGLHIAPASERRLRLRIAEEVPLVPGGQFEPTLRLLSVQTAAR